MIVGNAVISGKPLSVVRMGDGEVYLYRECLKGTGYIAPGTQGRYDGKWLRMLGCFNIPKNVLKERIEYAAAECSHFAPSISGIWRQDYNNHYLSFRMTYVDNFFVNDWTTEMKSELYVQAKHVLLIHGSTETADALQINLKKKLGVKVTFLKLTRWEDTEDIIKKAILSDASLVLFSAGPAGKYIAPRIAESNKVVLDVGNSIDHWTMAD
jgi:hypothetical protein